MGRALLATSCSSVEDVFNGVLGGGEGEVKMQAALLLSHLLHGLSYASDTACIHRA